MGHVVYEGINFPRKIPGQSDKDSFMHGHINNLVGFNSYESFNAFNSSDISIRITVPQ